MGKYFLLLSSLLLSGVVQGQSVNGGKYIDWRTDQNAYQSYRPPHLSIGRVKGFFGMKQIPIDPAFLRYKLEEFSGVRPIRIDDKEYRITERGSVDGRKLAVAYLAQEYRQIGYAVGYQKFRSSGGEGINFVAEKKGSDPSRVLIISSHLDSVNNAGADDDGSGTIGALALARALATLNLKYSIRVVAFDLEELGLLGSKAYVAELKNRGIGAGIIGDIQMDMVAYNGKKDGAFHIIDCDRKESMPLAAAILVAVQELNIPLKRTSACTNRSDHASFWHANIPAIAVAENFFGGDSNPCYHKKCDTLDKVDFAYMTNIIRALASATARIVGAE